MQHVLARSPESARELTFVVPQGLLPPGAGLFVAETECAVFTRDGMVAGVLGPGRHLLDPNYFPFLWNLRDASGQLQASVVFVSLAPASARWSLAFEAADTAVAVRGFGTTAYRVTDPMKFVHSAGADPTAFAHSLARGEHVQRAVKSAIGEAFSAGWQLTQLASDPARLAERAKVLANGDVAAYGIEVLELSELALTTPEQPQPTPAASEPVYEMLWDCRHCQSTKLLGLTHRHCPNCGAPQNPAERYFPSDSEKVAVQNHVYYGADRSCHYCHNPNSRNSKHCGTCGGPLEEGTDIARRQDQLHAIGGYSGESAEDARRELAGLVKPPLPARKKTRWGLVLGSIAATLVLGFLTLLVVAIVWTKPAGLEVAAHEWKREIDVERFGPVDETDWCDSVPRGATVKGRSRAVRSHEKIQKGEKCRTRKVDQGDGTYRESRECDPVYESKPVYDDECRYTINKWSKHRTLAASGGSLGEQPKWPEVKLAEKCDVIGCEREGKRTQSYTVRFVQTENQEKSSCTFEQDKWQSFKPGSRWVGEVGVIGGIVDCDSLKQK